MASRPSIFPALAAFLAACAMAASDPAAAEAISSDEYARRLEQIASLIEPGGAGDGDLCQVIEDLPGSWTVLAGGREISVSTGPIRGHLDGGSCAATSEADLEPLRRRVLFMIEEARSLDRFAGLDHDQARAALDRILEREEFAALKTRGLLDGLRRTVREKIEEVLGELLGMSVDMPSMPGWFPWLVTAALLAAVILWLARWLRRHAPPLHLGSLRPHRPRDEGAALLRQAARLSESAQYREAIHCAYRAALHHLDKIGVWTLAASRTHREYLDLLPADHAFRPPIRELTHRFERVWYGLQPASEDDYVATTNQLQELGCRPDSN